MDKFEVKNLVLADNNLSIKECSNVLLSDDSAIVILDENRELHSFVLKESIDRMMRFELENQPIKLIATPCKTLLSDEIDNTSENVFFISEKGQNPDRLFVRSNIKQAKINLTEQFESFLPEKVKTALALCAVAADEINMPIYLIGGIVRDLIIQKDSFDVDISVQENAIEFAYFMQKKYPEKMLLKEIHEEFKTAKVTFLLDNSEVEIDIASTRKETYPYPASLPLVKTIGCELIDDVIRRDFTVNSMALSLNKENFCDLIDYLGGYQDIKNKKLRILHPVSFIDDPTRILRALKFKVRFGYELDDVCLYLLRECVNSGIFDDLASDRIKAELKQLFNLNKSECYDYFLEENVHRFISSLVPKHNLPSGMRVHSNIDKFSSYIENKENIWLIYLSSIVSSLEKEQITALSKKLNLSSLETKTLLNTRSIITNEAKIAEFKTMFEVYEFFECYFNESIISAYGLIRDEKILGYIDKYLMELQFISIKTNGKDLIDRAMIPSPLFGEILRDILKEKINGNILTSKDESAYLDKVLGKRNLN